MKNLIIEKSFKYGNQVLKNIDKNIIYNQALGFWVSLTDNKPLILSDTSYKPQSKKCDVETGEDKKGE